MNKRINILIAEPSTIIRSGLASILTQSCNVLCDVIEINDVSALISGTCNYTKIPDILIINPSNVGHFSVTALKWNAGNEDLKIIALQSGFVEPAQLNNYDTSLSIYDASDTIADRIEHIIKPTDTESNKKEDLSIREKEIIVCVVKGMTNKQIAEALTLSTHTVIAHRRNIANKLQIHSPSGLTIYAIVNKLVDLSEIKNTISQGNRAEEV